MAALLHSPSTRFILHAISLRDSRTLVLTARWSRPQIWDYGGSRSIRDSGCEDGGVTNEFFLRWTGIWVLRRRHPLSGSLSDPFLTTPDIGWVFILSDRASIIQRLQNVDPSACKEARFRLGLELKVPKLAFIFVLDWCATVSRRRRAVSIDRGPSRPVCWQATKYFFESLVQLSCPFLVDSLRVRVNL